MNWQINRGVFGLTIVLLTALAQADPCGMVPPIYRGPGVPIARIGHQQTYVFYKDGIESFVIRPGFEGKVEEFGMLIPFPTPPAIRKVSDNIFSQIANAVDPPEVVVYAGPAMPMAMEAASNADGFSGGLRMRALRKNEVNVISEEAVGMYEVAVLEAGSAGALKKWMEQHKYRFPDGMESVCNDYVADRWCFVAVKTKVGGKSSVDPQPGQRKVAAEMPAGSTFDGHVQAMGFRFKSDELVVPMRLSAFNDGELRNIVYLLTAGPRRIRSIPEEYVVRQITGEQLVKNLTSPLPLRIVGGTVKDLQEWHYQNLEQRRDPYPRNGAAKELFASDMIAFQSGEMSLRHEEREKELLRIGERLGLRGPEIDRLNQAALREQLNVTVGQALAVLCEMTLTVVDGDFPRDVISNQNLTFDEFSMPKSKNNAQAYHAVFKGPDAGQRGGTLIYEKLEMPARFNNKKEANPRQRNGVLPRHSESQFSWLRSSLLLGSMGLVWFALYRKPNLRSLANLILVVSVIATGYPATGAEGSDSLDTLIEQLSDGAAADQATDELIDRAKQQRESIVHRLVSLANDESAQITARGWAIAALGKIGGLDIDEALLKIHSKPAPEGPAIDGPVPRQGGRSRPIMMPRPQAATEHQLIQTWAAAARVAMCGSPEAIIEKAQLIHPFPALSRPISQRLVDQLAGSDVSVEQLLETSMKVPQVAGALAPAIMARGADELIRAMTSSDDQNIRRQAAAYLATLGGQDVEGVANAVIETYRFANSAADVPWDGGPLFVPSINWSKEAATNLMRQLVAWDIWAAERDEMDLQRQLHNNLRNLAQRLGIQQNRRGSGFNWQFSSPREWFQIWGQIAGRETARELLMEVGVDERSSYWKTLNKLKS